MGKLWGGRFEKNTDKLVDEFNSSINIDKRLYKQDIMGSIAHAQMLGKQDIIPAEDSEKIVRGLQEILSEIENGKIEFDISNEDIHMNIESLLTKKIGDAGKRLHTARSRNDQVALDIRLYIKEETKNIKDFVLGLIETLTEISLANVDTILPGYTHLQRAQPITLAHHLIAYISMFKRDYERLNDSLKRVNLSPLGSCAMATTSFNIDRKFVADELGFEGVTINSIDSVSDRDFLIELCSSIALIMMHLSRFCEEIILWSSSEFAFIELDDAYSTGSSIMPQKKNPDIAELVRGKTGRVYGDLMALLTIMKGIPLAYNKDMQEDKEAIFDAIDTVKNCLRIFMPMLETMEINKTNMLNAAKKGFTNATDLADYLVEKGLAFREAHEVSGKIVRLCIYENKVLEDVTLEEYKAESQLFEKDVYEKIDIKNCVETRKVYGGPSSIAINKVLFEIKDWLSKQD